MPDANEVTCRECGFSFVPSFVFDFYPDGKDPKVGRCENCFMAKALGTQAPTNSNNPTPISEGHAKTVCKFGQRATTCSFLGMTGSQFHCLKGSEFESNIKQRREEGSMGAMGDNCSGPPDFNVIAA